MQNKHSKAVNLGVSLKTFLFPLLEQNQGFLLNLGDLLNLVSPTLSRH